MTADLPHDLLLVAAAIEDGYPGAGAIVRRAARVLAGQAPTSGCVTCGAELVQSGRGRPRRYCPPPRPCKRRAEAAKRGEMRRWLHE